MPIIRPGKPTTAISFIAPLNRYAEIHATLPKLKKQLASKWKVTRLSVRIQNPVHFPNETEIHLIAETAKDYAYLAGLGYAMWKFLKKQFPWIKKPKRQKRKKRSVPRT